MTRPIHALALLASLLAATAARADEQTHITRARQIVQLFLDEKYDEFVASGVEQVQKALTPAAAKQAHDQIIGLVGKIEAERSAVYKPSGPMHSVTFTLVGEKAAIKLEVVLDEAGRMSGFWSRGIEAKDDTPASYVDKSRFREEKVVIKTGEIELPGTLTIPVTRMKHPAVVLVHGSGPHDEDETILVNKPFRDLAWGLASEGVAVLRYEKRTHKYAQTIKVEELTIKEEVIDDALSAVELLRTRGEVDPARIFVVGHSLGAMAAPLIAQRDSGIAGIALIASPARSLLDVIPDQVEYIIQSDGAVSDEEKAQLEQIREAVAKIRSGEADPRTPILGAPAAYWKSLSQVDQVAAAEQLKIPILIVQGGRDYQITKKDYDLWRQRLQDHSNVTFRLYDNLSHLMMAGEGPSTPAEYQKAGHVDQALVHDLALWVQSAGASSQPSSR